MRAMLDTQAGLLFVSIIALIAAATVVSLVVLWPGDVEPELGELSAESEVAEVKSLTEVPCLGFQTDTCVDATVVLESGEDEGTETVLRGLGGGGGPLPLELEIGNEVRVTPNFVPPGAAPQQPTQYTLSDFERRAPMLWLALAFAALVIVFGRLRGALSLAGLAISLLIVLLFVVPAILDGSEPLIVAIVGALAVMLVTITLAHGLGPKGVAAILGTALSLALVALLALAFTDLTHLTGLASEESVILAGSDQGISFEGLLLAGMVIGALGVLDDVTVSQASTVMALRRANPAHRFGELYRGAIAVGRDHVSATVNTLVLAYVGASLPVLLVFSSSTLGFADAVNGELVAKEIVAMLVGSIGLIAAVPLTTGLAAVLSTQLDPEQLGDETAHAH